MCGVPISGFSNGWNHLPQDEGALEKLVLDHLLDVIDKGGASVSHLSQQLGMYYDTVWHLVQKLRYAMGKRDEGLTLAGFIELDDGILGPQARKPGRPRTSDKRPEGPRPRLKRLGTRNKKGRKWKKQQKSSSWSNGRISGGGSLVMKVVQTKTRADIREVIEQRIDEGKHTFKSDAYQPHFVIRSMGHELQASALANDPASIEELPIVHRAISLLKRMLIGTYHGVSSKYSQLYLNEFCFRWNRRDRLATIFHSPVTACGFALPLTYSELTL